MPLTLKNVQILTMPRYDAYRKQMQEFANNNKIVMLDLADFNKYPPEDFQDTVHLNAFGARKFFDSLAAALHANPTTAGYIRSAAAESSNTH
jgi:lysophospholipase L1-like esterase